eukprot:12543999-Ditylum_brightwellii.AAC.1
MDCIGWWNQGRIWVFWFCGGNWEQDSMEGNIQSQGNHNQMESLCAENSGGIAALCFLVHNIEYYSIKPRTDLILYFCDNNTLVGHIQ